MTPRMVGGFPCTTCAEEALAKKGFDPSTPVALQPRGDEARRGEPASTGLGVNAPRPGEIVGGRLNVRA